MTDAEKIARLASALRHAVRFIAVNDQGRCRGCGRYLTHANDCAASQIIYEARIALSDAGVEP